MPTSTADPNSAPTPDAADLGDYTPADDRYKARSDAWFRRCGRTGLMLPAISLGCWHNFGGPGTDAAKHTSEDAMHDNARAMLRTAFDHGITHFDLANNYGPPPGSAEERVGNILYEDFADHRDELIISTKAGYRMWPGPYGEWGSRKYLLASLDASLDRLGLDYVDIFYSHRPDPQPGGTPLEETMAALDTAVQSGKALYAGISSYSGAATAECIRICERDGLTKPIIHQPNYSMLHRGVEADLLKTADTLGLGTIAFCPLAQGQLTDKYLGGIPDDSRAAQESGFLKKIKEEVLDKAKQLNQIAQARGQSLAQMALQWTVRAQRSTPGITSALIGASRPSQIEENVKALDAAPLSEEELKRIEAILA